MPNVIGNPDKGVFTPGRLPQISEPVMRLNPASDPRKMRRIIAEDPEWSLAIIPLLRDLCLQHIVKNFENNPILNELLPSHKAKVLEKLSTKLPLKVTANLISHEGYWNRCCTERWGVCDVACYGNSWKRMFFERHLEKIIELFIPDVTDIKTVLDVVPLCKNYVKKLNISQLLPPVKEPQMNEDDNASDTASDLGHEGPSIDHFDFWTLLDKLTHLEELHLVYGVSGCGMNFEWNLFEFTYRDCQSLAKALKSCKTLKVFRIHQSKVDDEKVRLLINSLLDHPFLTVLDLSHNLIGDRGARAIGKLINERKMKSITVYDNKIRAHGAQAIAYALTKNTTLTSLNLRLNQIGDEGGQAIAHALLKNATLTNIHMGSNELTEPTATVLSQVLVQNKTLRNINLSCNRLGLDGGKQIQEGMSYNTTVVEFDVRLTEIGQESEYSISQILQNNQEKARKKLITESGVKK
ncbi:dynein regulatory complex subunit 5 [Huso huso]|uniref:Dynein regulatory complex subunit 5 n=1 Tax=Huso huso TaxID=61971 RepID=A0ABR0ZVQ9_HUSHU